MLMSRILHIRPGCVYTQAAPTVIRMPLRPNRRRVKAPPRELDTQDPVVAVVIVPVREGAHGTVRASVRALMPADAQLMCGLLCSLTP